ncbi:MAG: 4-hydroxy-3-methylbut-2-enyl diphosphate reductase [Candidatus Omnitrophica bacterium]|nr:4-hydroxy-3-methylbut-2-enyl diphosphate reductase [Candidatus Omnitrophota bacterium]
MQINLAKSRGFCFGVKRAIKLAIKMRDSKKNVFILGDIVHNEEVVNRLKEKGIKRITKLLKPKIKDTVLILGAHGTDKDTYKRAKGLGFQIVDATCPMVKNIHRLAQQMEDKGYPIIVIGDKNHAEVKGILGQLKKKALVIEKNQDIPLKVRRIKKASLVVQSTQNLEDTLKIVNSLKKFIPHLKFFNTICKPTRVKQIEIKSMATKNDVMIIVGSKKSANTKRLYEIASSLNKKSYWISAKNELNPIWFKGIKTVGLATGASTPEWIVKEIIDYLKNLPKT